MDIQVWEEGLAGRGEATFVVACYNNSERARDCISSLRAHFPDAPLVMVDDASAEDHAAEHRRVAREHEARLLRCSVNCGPAAAQNVGVREAHTPLTVLCDNDVVFLGSDWLTRHATLLSDESLGVVGGWGNPEFLDSNLYCYHSHAYFGEEGYCEAVRGGLMTARTQIAQEYLQEEIPGPSAYLWCLMLREAGLKVFLSPAQIDHHIGWNDHHYPNAGGTEDERRLLALPLWQHRLMERQSLSNTRFFMQHGRWMTPEESLVRTAEQLTMDDRAQESDIQGHLELLSRLAALCNTVTEFGVREGLSTAAFLAGHPRRVTSYDLYVSPRHDLLVQAAVRSGVEWVFVQGDTLAVPTIESCDLLLVDSLHRCSHVAAELERHAARVNKYLIFHDISTFGDMDDHQGPGIWNAIAAYIKSNPQWHLLMYFTHDNGLAVLERR